MLLSKFFQKVGVPALQVAAVAGTAILGEKNYQERAKKVMEENPGKEVTAQFKWVYPGYGGYYEPVVVKGAKEDAPQTTPSFKRT